MKKFIEKEHYMGAWKRKMISVLSVMLAAAAIFLSSAYTVGNPDSAAGGKPDWSKSRTQKRAGRKS